MNAAHQLDEFPVQCRIIVVPTLLCAVRHSFRESRAFVTVHRRTSYPFLVSAPILADKDE